MRQPKAVRHEITTPRRIRERGYRAHRAYRAFGGVALVAGLLAGLAACSSGGAGNDQTSNASYESSQPLVTYPVAKRQPAPVLSGTTLTGAHLSTASLRGKVIVLNVWGSWCTACRVEGPSLEQAYQQTKDKGVVFLGIDTRDTADAAKAYDVAEHITYPSLQDPTEALTLKFRSIVPSTSVPSTVIIDRQGRVAVRDIDAFSSTSQVLSILNPIIAES
jgi:thiol-disulfide isomerase/thioredoxin